MGASKWNKLVALAILPALPVVILLAKLAHDDFLSVVPVLSTSIVAILGFLITLYLVPLVCRKTLKKGMFGFDLNKAGTDLGNVKVPESAGLATGTAFLVCVIALLVLARGDDGNELDFKEQVNFTAALAGIGFMLFLGFADDVLDIPWRVKLILPTLGALPLLASYTGNTSVLIPMPVRTIVGSQAFQGAVGWLPGGLGTVIVNALSAPIVDLGVLYYAYMLLLTVFCTNSINILAGVNGLEAGQSLIIAWAIAFHNISQLSYGYGAGGLQAAHIFSFNLMLVFAGTTLGMLRYNWYPSAVFVGDSYTYFAGMTFAVAGILGHFSETMLLFMIPQVANFAYSLPQLFKVVPCPRHRLPKLDKETGLLHPSFADPGKKIYNMNLVTLMLRLFGPCTEEVLTIRLLAFQVVSCIGSFILRAALTGWYKS